MFTKNHSGGKEREETERHIKRKRGFWFAQASEKRGKKKGVNEE